MRKVSAVFLVFLLLAAALGNETVEAAFPTSFNVEEWVSTTLLYSENDTITWRKMFPGEVQLPSDNNITVRVEMETNVASDIYVRGDDFSCTTPEKCGSSIFSISNLTVCNTSLVNDTGCWPWNVTGSYGPSGGYYQNVPAPGGSPISKLFTFFLSTPAAQQAGGYQANITLKTIKAGDVP